jgi:hypothetical protein
MDAKAQYKSQPPPAATCVEKWSKPLKERTTDAPVASMALNLTLQLPPECREFVATAADRFYLGCFLSSHQSSPITPILFHYSTSSTFKYAARAGTMAFYAKMRSDLALQRESSVWYDKAIQLQLTSLSTMEGLSPNADSRLPTPEDILTPLMLALYETALCTSPLGWVHHLAAGATMLEKLGPERCQSGDFHKILLGVRHNMVSLSILLCMRML